MKGLDTNILVRYFVQDDQAQTEKATQFIEKTVTEGENFNNIVLYELVWVLESAYGYSKAEIADLLEKVLKTIKEQHAIATVLSDMDAEIATLETRLAKAQALKQGMIQELLTGRIRLKMRIR